MEHRTEAASFHEGVDKLCESCAKLPLTEDEINRQDIVTQYPGIRYVIGTLSEIRMRTWCPMCRLILAAYLNDPRHEPSAYDREACSVVAVIWRQYRKGFEVTLTSVGTRLSFVRRVEDRVPFGQGRRVCTGQIDTELITGWLRRCQQQHESHCRPVSRTVKDMASTSLNVPLRLIDVRKRCIIQVESPSIYVTLSYVWGKARTLRLLKENKHSLVNHFALDLSKNEIPRTILDAMDLVTRLGFPYLWVDALCIVQDDDEELIREVQNMDRIYENSLFTIIAANGADANAGLPGVRPNSRQDHQILEHVSPSASLVALYELDDLLRTQVYSTRAWTFQERILSRRNVVFVNGQVFFQCRIRTWSEDTCYESKPSNATPDAAFGSLVPMALSLDAAPHQSFRDLIMYYSERKLSYESDALKAAAGLLRMLAARFGWKTFQGLPTLCLDAYLLFNMAADDLDNKRRGQFPSYSWVGWTGRVRWFDYSSPLISESFIYGEPTSWVRERTWIKWCELGVDGKVCSISDLPGIDSDSSILKSAARQRLQRVIPTIRQDVEKSALTIDISNLGHRQPYPLLAFWTVSIKLKVVANAESGAGDDPFFELFDKDSSFCGVVEYNEPPRQMPEKPSEFILLSETDYPIHEFPVSKENGELDNPQRNEYQAQFDRDEGRIPHDGDEDEDAESGGDSAEHRSPSPLPDRWKYYWVMLIEWDNGIAERRGIGQIYKTAAEKSFPPGPVWKQIVLA